MVSHMLSDVQVASCDLGKVLPYKGMGICAFDWIGGHGMAWNITLLDKVLWQVVFT